MRVGWRCSEKQDADEGECGAEKGVPAGWRVRRAAEVRGSMEKSGTRTTTSPVMKADLEGVVRDEAGGLELVADGETEANDRCRRRCGRGGWCASER